MMYKVQGILGTKKSKLAKHFGIKPATVNDRIRRGMSLEEALTKPVNKYNKNK